MIKRTRLCRVYKSNVVWYTKSSAFEQAFKLLIDVLLEQLNNDNINLFAQSSAKKSHAPGQERNKQKSTGSTSLERKVQHLDKEKKRR